MKIRARWTESARLCAALIALALLTACSARIVPPPSPMDPVSVWVLDHGQHSSLMIPAERGLARYSWGDWNWYAEGRTGIASGLNALLVPSPSALGRQLMPNASDLDSALAAMSVAVAASTELRVEADAVRRLRESLDAYFEAASQRHHNPAYDLIFVADERPYTLADNSNRRVGEWLTELGCEIRGRPVLSGWRIAAPR